MQTENGKPTDEVDFDSVFARDDVSQGHDSGAQSVAPEATSQPRDENGRFTSAHGTVVEDQHVDPKPQGKEPEAQGQQQALPQEAPDQDHNRTAPLSEVLKERDRYRTEKTAREAAERQLAELQGKLSAFEQFQSRPQVPQQQAQREEVPDAFTDPAAYVDYRERQMLIAQREQISNFSEAIARRQFGNEIVEKATQWAVQNNVARHFFFNARDPYGELIETYKQQQAMSRIGSDPDAYEKRIREEERQKVLEELKAGKGNGQQQTVFPGSLASATPTGRQGGHLDPQTAADSVFQR